jgi:hypothetical protein
VAVVTPEELQRAQAAHDEAITRRFGPPEPPAEFVTEVMNAYTTLGADGRSQLHAREPELYFALERLVRGPS